MTIDQWVSISASIGACLSAIAALFAVKLSSKHSRASYKPELVISKKPFKSSATSSDAPTDWLEIDDEENSDTHKRSYFSLPLSNVGLGAAKQIEVNWSFPIESMVKSVNKITQENHIQAYFKYDNGMLSYDTESGKKSVSVWRNQKESKLDFVLPSSVESNSSELFLPPAYIQLVSAVIYFYFQNDRKEQFPDLPNIQAKVSYFDIGGKKHTCKFELSTEIAMITGNGSEFQGYIESKNA
ncbi:hypothetical protein [Vibrio sp. 11-4(1)]|uniref:hypothetical protein n=1 Tax=Vibrio sp. 11-4(1) TaxID=2591018 RepID=UPI001483672E|nr:hypothetical protein [Vibrio sp. 11-4(1)]NNN82395.1 hypothetical protein [Vibrio sp. 11-4(1)]